MMADKTWWHDRPQAQEDHTRWQPFTRRYINWWRNQRKIDCILRKKSDLSIGKHKGKSNNAYAVT